MSYVDIMLLIAVIIGPIIVFIAAMSYRWYLSLLPMGIFLIFWMVWYFLDTTVPYDFTDKVWFLVISLVSLAVGEALGLVLRYDKMKTCDPKIAECKF